MVEIIYGKNIQEADFQGRSVAQVREQLKDEFGVPDKAKARLNGKSIKKGQEADTFLQDEDELLFDKKNRRGLMITGAFLLVLLLTGGLFAFTTVTQTSSITVTDGGADFVSIAANTTDSPTYTVLGQHRGVISEGSLFDVTVDTNYTGDLVVSAFLNNVDTMQNDYSNWTMRLKLTNSANVSIDIQSKTEVITLDNPIASWEVQSTNLTAPVYIHVDGGSYKAYSSGWLSGVDPSFYAQAVQGGSH